MRVARRLHSDLVLGPEAVGKHSQLLVAQRDLPGLTDQPVLPHRDLRKLAVDIQPDTSASHHDLHWLVIMGARRANDTYGSALKAHPGNSQGRPTTNTRSRRNARDRPAQPCVRSRMPRGPDGRTVLTKPEALNSCNGPVMRRRWHLMPFIPDTDESVKRVGLELQALVLPGACGGAGLPREGGRSPAGMAAKPGMEAVRRLGLGVQEPRRGATSFAGGVSGRYAWLWAWSTPERSAGSGMDACRAACPAEGLVSRVPLAAATLGLAFAGPRACQSATSWRYACSPCSAISRSSRRTSLSEYAAALPFWPRRDGIPARSSSARSFLSVSDGRANA